MTRQSSPGSRKRVKHQFGPRFRANSKKGQTPIPHVEIATSFLVDVEKMATHRKAGAATKPDSIAGHDFHFGSMSFHETLFGVMRFKSHSSMRNLSSNLRRTSCCCTCVVSTSSITNQETAAPAAQPRDAKPQRFQERHRRCGGTLPQWHAVVDAAFSNLSVALRCCLPGFWITSCFRQGAYRFTTQACV